MSDKTLVLGLGNEILTDDAIGLHVARELRQRLDPQRFDVVESGLVGLRLLELIAGYRRLVIVDAVNAPGAAAGEVLRLSLDQLGGAQRMESAHDVDLASVVETARRMGIEAPAEVVAYGIQIGDSWAVGEGLTPTLERALPGIVSDIAAELERVDARGTSG